nr:MAG TPA: hypothetical protein [Caudoviricetes sp.]
MFYYWKHHGIRPSVFYSMQKGELTVIQAFYEKELEERDKVLKEMRDNKVVCPYQLFV